MGLKTKNHSLGRAIIKDKFKGRNTRSKYYRHTTELDDGLNWNSSNFKSVTEENTLDEFLTSAELAGAEFIAERINVTLVTETNCLPSKEELLKTKLCQEENVQLLKIPRRPTWNVNTTPDELDAMERQSFLEWRRSLSMLLEKEGIILTPYEKNLEFWRQLWRVIEKSDVVVQIVDARNPMFFYCKDLNAYVKEMGKNKVNILLINKADFLTDKQRTFWCDFFTSVDIKIIFWSATSQPLNNEQDAQLKSSSEEGSILKVKELSSETDSDDTDTYTDDETDKDDGDEKEQSSDDEHDDDDDASESEESICDDVKLEKNTSVKNSHLKSCRENEAAVKNFNNTTIVTVDELIEIFKSFKNPDEPLLTVGLIGYPNVGKSSTINTLLTKRVALNEQAEKSKMYQTSVSTTPGKTKHFQTFYLDKDLLLCDCPGLVMPMFVNAKAEMITNGILSIDHMTDFVPPISIVCHCIPKVILEVFYSVMLPKPPEGEDPNRAPTAYELLSAYARIRGFMTHKGVPDYQRAARIILKDFVHGHLNYCYAPPGVSENEYESAPSLSMVNKLKNKNEADEKSFAVHVRPEVKSELDEEFFKKLDVGFTLKGDLTSIGLKHLCSTAAFSSNSSSCNIPSSEKPSKKHFKSNRREKSRRTNSHFDA